MTNAATSTHSAPIATRMQRLREATRQAHMQIEGALPVLDPMLTRARYAGVIAAFFGFYAELEPRLVAATKAHATDIELGRYSKVSLLRCDLRGLGKTDAEIESLPRCLELPLAVTPSQALGVLYVLEGATLGGQVIARNLQAALGLGATNGAAFFIGYGAETRAMWAKFSQYVDRAPALDSEVVIASALDTFEKLRCWLVATGKS